VIDAMSQVFAFGERREGFAFPVPNECAVRAAAGIMFFFAIVSFMNAWLVGNFQPTRHIHRVTPDGKAAGHIDDLTPAPGMALRLSRV
jgi:hypothetical protein